MENVGIAIKEYLKQQGLTQQAVADRLGKSQQQIAIYLSGKKNFGRTMAQAFADEFGFSYTFLITGEGTLFADAEAKAIADSNNDSEKASEPESAEYWKAKYEAAQEEIVRLNELLRIALGGSIIPKADVG